MNGVGRSAVTVGAMLLIGVGAVGCDSSPDPVETSTGATPSSSSAAPSPSASSSPTASPTPSATASGPAIPAAARKKTDAGAEAFVKYFFDQYNKAWTTPRVGVINDLSVKGCAFCAKGEETTKTLVERGDRFESEPIRVRSVRVFGGAPESQAYVYADMIQLGTRIVAQDGDVVRTIKEEDFPANVVLKWTAGRWALLGVERA